jgi:hypothetical protein
VGSRARAFSCHGGLARQPNPHPTGPSCLGSVDAPLLCLFFELGERRLCSVVRMVTLGDPRPTTHSSKQIHVSDQHRHWRDNPAMSIFPPRVA